MVSNLMQGFRQTLGALGVHKLGRRHLHQRAKELDAQENAVHVERVAAKGLPLVHALENLSHTRRGARAVLKTEQAMHIQ